MKKKRRVQKPEVLYFTKEGYDRIKKELKEYQDSRKGAVDTLSAARALGDLSENGLYTAAKSRLRHIDTEINRRLYYLKVGIVKESQTNTVSIGSTVEVKDGSKSRIFQIVGDTESDPLNGKITQKSPIGSALIGKGKGDTVKINTPAGAKIFIINKIS